MMYSRTVTKGAPAPAPTYDELVAKAAELREGIDALRECDADRLTQYQSECALFGDAGPGQHPSCWAGQSQDMQADFRAELAVILAAMEVLRPGAAKAAADAEAAAWAAECADVF